MNHEGGYLSEKSSRLYRQLQKHVQDGSQKVIVDSLFNPLEVQTRMAQYRGWLSSAKIKKTPSGKPIELESLIGRTNEIPESMTQLIKLVKRHSVLHFEMVDRIRNKQTLPREYQEFLRTSDFSMWISEFTCHLLGLQGTLRELRDHEAFKDL
jgi:predicted transcriptional regulator